MRSSKNELQGADPFAHENSRSSNLDARLRCSSACDHIFVHVYFPQDRNRHTVIPLVQIISVEKLLLDLGTIAWTTLKERQGIYRTLAPQCNSVQQGAREDDEQNPEKKFPRIPMRDLVSGVAEKHRAGEIGQHQGYLPR